MSADRLPPLARETWDAEQTRAAEEIISGPRGQLVAPFIPLLRSPELMMHAQRMGSYLRYRSALGKRLTELAILVTARAWSQPVEWAIHAPIAESEGIARATIEAIAAGLRPVDMTTEEATVHDFCRELHATRHVSDRLWDAAIAHFGERGTVDLIGIAGYYTFLSMVMNSARTPAPDSSAAPLVDAAG